MIRGDSSTYWSSQEDARLRELADAGWLAPGIARLLRRSVKGVISRASALGISVQMTRTEYHTMRARLGLGAGARWPLMERLPDDLLAARRTAVAVTTQKVDDAGAQERRISLPFMACIADVVDRSGLYVMVRR